MSRLTIDIASASGGWPSPWPNVAELASVLPIEKWTLVDGLMTQLHTVHHRIGVVRLTNDVDIVLHIETNRGVPAATPSAAENLNEWKRTGSTWPTCSPSWASPPAESSPSSIWADRLGRSLLERGEGDGGREGAVAP